MFTCKEYRKAETLEEAWQLNQKKSSLLIGGMLWVKMGSRNAGTVIDLSGLGLNKIEETETEFVIGCMTTLRQLERNEALNRFTNGAVRESVRNIVGVQFRNLATVGGSVFGRFGFSDVLTMLLALDSYVELYKGGPVPMREFVNRKRDRDILVRVRIKKTPGYFACRSVRNAGTDFPTLVVAAALTEKKLTLSVGARPARAMLLELSADELETLTKGSLPAEALGDYAAARIPVGSNLRASAAYRTELVKVLVKRVCADLEAL